ncbi:MAG TPA: M20/M25/M40 family metallo-hydrolase [Pyrinomonadaceae bacterium]|jgi:acetylornithine deacetylase|nr:M20/M25/M40 family metallo-hydrolase [Pyrinomonadaceae bacterium]
MNVKTEESQLFELTRNLIDIPSVTGEEGEVSRFLASRLAGLGYEVETQEIAPHRANVLARVAGARARVVLSTHMDTVPPHVASSEDADFIHGRGACDAKGIIAAQIAAAERLRAEGVEGIGLLFTVDEEMGSDGARAANGHAWGRDCRFLVNGEPTGNRLAAGTKGSLRVRLTASGREAHSAYPERGDSAIEKLLGVLSDIRAHSWRRDDFFGETTCNVGTISGGTRPNVVAAEAAADLQFRLVTSAREVKEALGRIAGGRVGVEYLSENEPIRLATVEGFEQEVVRFTTDIPYLANWGAPLLVGPGSILVAHTLEERVAKRELAEAVGIYTRLARTLLARAPEAADGGANAGGAAR